MEHVIPMADQDLVLVRMEYAEGRKAEIKRGPDHLGKIMAMRLTGDKVEMLTDHWMWWEVGTTNKVVYPRKHPIAKYALKRLENLAEQFLTGADIEPRDLVEGTGGTWK